MRMKMVCDDRTLREVANEFLALKKAQKVRERTLNDYKKYIDKFLEQSESSLDVDVLKMEILEYFADIPKTSPASPSSEIKITLSGRIALPFLKTHFQKYIFL